MSEKNMAVIRWSLYWILILSAYTVASIICDDFIIYLPIPILACLNFALRILLNLPFRRIESKKTKRIIRIVISAITLSATVVLYENIITIGSEYNNQYIESLDYSVFSHNSEVAYNHTNGVYSIKGTKDQIKVLQLTDIHLCGSITTVETDKKAFNACYELIKEAQPDLIIVTGDIVYPVFSRNNLKPIYQFCSFMNNIGIPWAMVYGNHDTEAVASYDKKSLEGLFRYFKEETNCPMLYTDNQPDVYGRYNQYLRIENADGSLNKLFFLVDSNDYVTNYNKVNEYDSVHEDQIQWYSETIDSVSAEEGNMVKSFVFMHIPFEEFSDAEEELKAGGSDAVYLFGGNGEKVCYPTKNTGFFSVILSKKSTEAVFVGHDHLNNMGIKYKGVDLVYSKSIDYIAYPGIAKLTQQRGATLITLSQNGNYKIEQVDYTI